MNTHNTHRVHRIDTHAQPRVVKRAPLIDWSNPVEVASLIALAIGAVVLVGMLAGVL